MDNFNLAEIVQEVQDAYTPVQQSLMGMDFQAYVDGGCSSSDVSDAEGNTYLHKAVQAGASQALVAAIAKLIGPNTVNADGDAPLHLAARTGHVEACKALLARGADALLRNNKNRTPRGQIKIPDDTKDMLLEGEEAAKQRRALKASGVWDDKMRETQTESAFGIRCL